MKAAGKGKPSQQFILPAQGMYLLTMATQPAAAAVTCALPLTWRQLLDGAPVPAFLSAVVPKVLAVAGVPEAAAALKRSPTSGCSLDQVLTLARRTAGAELDADAPLMESGIDSLGAVELRNNLQSVVGKSMSLPSTLAFDHPTARQLATFLQPVTSTAETSGTVIPLSDTNIGSQHTSAVLALGSSALLPSAASWLPTSLGGDVLCEVPVERWDVAPALAMLLEPMALRLRHGGFCRRLDLIDNFTFGVSAAETVAMAPEQRLLLEHGYSAFHASTLNRNALAGSPTGIFVGLGGSEFIAYLAESPAGASAFAATGTAPSIACGRMSHALGLHGPCIAVDTACSSALTACHSGVMALRHGECHRALAMGVSLMLTPAAGMSFAIAGMTSMGGRSHTFDARADGYARGEACGTTTMAHQAGKTWEIQRVKGSAVRQDGRSASLTAPNGPAQQGLLRAALADAALLPDSICINEAHGTGTALGDPIEAGALAAAILTPRAGVALPLAWGGVKANLGHGEHAAGMTGLLKLTTVLASRYAAPNAQLRVQNPHVRQALRGTHALLPVHLVKLEDTKDVRARGVSSFGYGGTVVHTALQCDGKYSHCGPRSVLCYRRQAFGWRKQSASSDVTSMKRPKETGTLSRMSPMVPSNFSAAAESLSMCSYITRLHLATPATGPSIVLVHTILGTTGLLQVPDRCSTWKCSLLNPATCN